jgi:hypothetical protein
MSANSVTSTIDERAAQVARPRMSSMVCSLTTGTPGSRRRSTSRAAAATLEGAVDVRIAKLKPLIAGTNPCGA